MNWYKISSSSPELKEIVDKFKTQYPGLDLFVWENNEKIQLDTIVVPPDMRNKGTGTTVIKELQQYARKVGKPIVLSPAPFKGKKKKLDNFYRKLDFVPNKGRNIDYTLTSPFAKTMYWKS
jgi:GNAT superfamily N-acetyltransferase